MDHHDAAESVDTDRLAAASDRRVRSAGRSARKSASECRLGVSSAGKRHAGRGRRGRPGSPAGGAFAEGAFPGGEDRGGHDPQKIYAAYKKACEHTGQPTVILAKTVKGYGLGEAGEALNIAHNFNEVGSFIVPVQRENTGYIFAKTYSLSLGFTVLHEEVVGWDDTNKKFKGEGEKYPYRTIEKVDYPLTATLGTAISNLRGSLFQEAPVAKGLTQIFTGVP